MMGRSLPSRGAWIEIGLWRGCGLGLDGSLPSRGAWIEIACPRTWVCIASGRSPHGERGLKYQLTILGQPVIPVAPLTGSVD